MKVILMLLLISCENTGKQSTPDDTAPDDALSECAQQVLEEGQPTAFEECFEGDGDSASCETCGYYMDVSMSQGAYDCITCFEGYEIDVVYTDCTGYCVPVGTATLPIVDSYCVPVSECVGAQ